MPEAIDKFSFFRSYHEATKRIEPQIRQEIFDAIVYYVFEGKVPETLSTYAESHFLLMKPTLDLSIKRAEAGSTGGSTKQKTSKPKAKGKQSSSKKKADTNQTARDKEVEEEREEDKEMDIGVGDGDESCFSAAEEDTTTATNTLKVMNGELGKGVLMLTDAQMVSLIDKMGLDVFNHYANKLSSFIVHKNATVRNHYQTILEWWGKDSQMGY